MNELFQFIEQNTSLVKEKPLESKKIISAQKELTRAGFPLIPENFLLLLKHCNGIKGEDGAILGISPENKSLDIVSFNITQNASKQKIILGYDDFALLVYDTHQEKYLLLDRTDGMELDDFLKSEFSSAINSVLHF